MKPHFILGMTLVFFTFPCFANEWLSVEPNTIKMRHAQDVLFKIKNEKPGMQLSITPGGVYIESEMLINAEHIISNDKDAIWLASKNKIKIYSKKSPELKHLKTLNLSQFQRTITYNKNLLVTNNRQAIFFQLDADLTAHLIFKTKLSSRITALSLSKTHACLLLENNTLVSVNLATKKHSQSKIQNENLQKVAAIDDFCLTSNNRKVLTLWQEKNNGMIRSSHYRTTGFIQAILPIEKKIILANGNSGFTMVKISNHKLQWLGSYNKLGHVTKVASWKKQLLTADDRGVISLFDISTAERPLLISNFHLHEKILDLSFKNNKAYALLKNKLVTINFSANSTPIISTQGVNQGGSRRSFIENNILYVADWFSGLHLYDISQPRAPRLLSSYRTPGSPKGVLVRKGIAFVADDDHGLQIIDVNDPYNPIYISDLPLSGLAYTMKFDGDLLYIASHREGFHIVDVGDEKHPKLLSTYDTPSKAWALEIQDEKLYVADDSSGLMIFDVKNPAKPQLLNQFNPGGFAEDVILKNNKAYIAFFDLGLMIVDITDPLNLKLLSHLKTPGNARGLDIKNNVLYLASWEAGVHIINISNDKKPEILGHYDTKGATWGLSINDHALFVMDWWEGVKILDVSKSQQPMLLGQYQATGKIKDILYQNDFIYTAHGSRGLQVYDAHNSLNPIWATGLDFDGDARHLALNKHLALIAAGDGGLVIADINNPFQIKWLSQLSIPSSVDFVQAINETVFAATKQGDLYFIDMSISRQPQVVERQKSTTQTIVVSNKALFHLNQGSILNKYSIDKTTKNWRSVSLDIQFDANYLAVNEQGLFLGAANGKIKSYKNNQNSLLLTTQIQLPEQLLALHHHENKLYVTTKLNKLYVYDITKKNEINLQYIYPTTHEIEHISVSKDAIFFSGETRIASGKLLPDVLIFQQKDGYIAKIPNNMPLGAYNVNITNPTGMQSVVNNAFQIAFPKFKSKFTLEDLKKKMMEKNLPSKTTLSP